MMSRRLRLVLPLAAIGLLAITTAGCGKKSPVTAPKENIRPLLQLTRAPFNQSTRFEYSYRMNWLGYDPDGRVDRYLYTIDPPEPTALNPEPESLWVQTNKTERVINFSATKLDSTDPGKNGSSDFHVFVVKAIDNGGLQSAPLTRAFFTYTVAPTCYIISPSPRDGARAFVTPSVRISWGGDDEDGIFDSKKPVKYKYILLTGNTPVTFSQAFAKPDSVRRYYAPRNWAGWDSTSADTTTVQFTNLVPGQDYMFCVIAFDEAGAYSPIFNMATNMLNMRATYAAVGGPVLTMFNEYFFYEYQSGQFSTLPQYVIPLEIPANEPVTFNWIGVAVEGADVQSYRWSLDIDDPTDLTPRTNERTDLKRWSTESALTTSATVGPFGGGENHYFYVMAEDNNGLKSLGIVNVSVVQSSLAKPLGIVKDTRYPSDQKSPISTCLDRPRGAWPFQAELDTFLFARGGFPWQCYPAGTISRPGIFSGYQFDTLGTRKGQFEVRVPLATIGNYAHLVWITDANAAQNFKPGTDPTSPICAMRYMSVPGRANSVGAYIKQGGEVWFVGGGVAYATLIPFNKTNNDGAVGITFSNTNLELIQGRFMYDLPHWQSEIKVANAPLSIFRNLARWDSLGSGPDVPAYRRFPLTMRGKSLALGDTFPPNRSVNPGDFYKGSFEVEYLSLGNRITEDVDPSPFFENEQSVLDTIYYAVGTTLPGPLTNRYNVCMTRYTGSASKKPVLFCGFNIWSFTRTDCKAVVDAVLQGLWGLFPTPTPGAAVAKPRPTAAAVQPWSPPGAGTDTPQGSSPGAAIAARAAAR